MASFSISYIFKMVDQFTGPASKLGQAAAAMSKQVHSAGAAANQMASSSSRIASAMNAVVSSVNSAARAVGNYIAQMARAATIKPLAPMLPGQNHRGAAWAIEQRRAAEAAAASKGSGGSYFGVGGGTLPNLASAYYLGRHAVHLADNVLSRPGDVDAMRQKIALATSSDEADRAVDLAKRLSRKYDNTTVLENLHVFDDLRANLPETFDKVLSHTAEPFVKMHAFFKAWEGGKHATHAETALRDIGAAIRAGELTGNMSAELLTQHTMALVAAKVLHGPKFKVQEYFQATQKAATALSAADRTFQYVDFPEMVMRLSQGGGVALATMFAKQSGIRMPSASVEMWRTLGLVDENVLRVSGALGRNGKVRPGGLTGTQWLKKSELYATNLTDAVMTDLVPALEIAAKAGKLDRGGASSKLRNLPGVDLAKAWMEKDIPKIVHLLETFRKGDGNMASLASAMSALGYDRNASKALEELLLGSGSIMRGRTRMKEIEAKDLEAIQTYDVAKQRLNASADRLIIAMTGTDGLGNVTKALDGLSKFMGDNAARIEKTNKQVHGLSFRDHEMDAATKDGTLALLMARRLIYGGGPSGIADSYRGLSPLAPGAELAALRFNAEAAIARTPFDNYGRLPEARETWLPRMFQFGPGYGDPMSWDKRSFASDAAAAIPQSMAIHVDPIQVNMPPSVRLDVNVTGQVNGPLSGSGYGELPMSAGATRGTATPDAGAPAGQSSN